MGTLLSIIKNMEKLKLSIVILCAGEGTRLKKITKITPKPLLKIEALNNISILYFNIKNLLNFEIDKIAIVIGHLGVKISEYISTLKKSESTTSLSSNDDDSKYKKKYKKLKDKCDKLELENFKLKQKINNKNDSDSDSDSDTSSDEEIIIEEL